jgi:cobalt-zinc-cadmium efflux system membrane fusion protein
MNNILYMKYSIIILLSAIILASCSGGKADKKGKEEVTEKASEPMTVDLSPEQYKSLGIESAKSELRKLTIKLQLNGVINVPPQHRVSINTPFGGFVKNLSVQEGSPIRQGQLLASIQNPEYIQLQQDYLENRSQLSFLEAEFKRQEELAREQVNSQKALQKAKADLDLNKAKLVGQRAKLEMLGINIQKLEAGEIVSTLPLSSPVNGYVTAVKSNQGAYIGNTDVILELMDAQHLYAELAVYEKDLPKLKIGQTVNLSVSSEENSKSGRIELIGRNVNDDRTIHVYCRFDRPDANLRPGLFLKGQVEISDFETLTVPETAVVNFMGKDYVFIARGKSFDMKEVKTGQHSDTYIEILEGLEANTEIVTKGAFQLLSTLKNSGEE